LPSSWLLVQLQVVGRYVSDQPAVRQYAMTQFARPNVLASFASGALWLFMP